ENLWQGWAFRSFGLPSDSRFTGDYGWLNRAAWGKVKLVAPEVSAWPNSSIVRLPRVSIGRGSINRLAATPLRPAVRFWNRPLPAPSFFTDATVTSILGVPGSRRKVSVFTRATISLTWRKPPF